MERLMSMAAIVLTVLSCLVTVKGYIYTTYYMEDTCATTKTFSSIGAISVRLTRNSVYRRNEHCHGTYKTGPGRRIMAKFQMISIEESVFFDCNPDNVVIRDGPLSTSPRLATLCGFTTPSRVYITSGRSITFDFNSDSSNQYKGFTVILTDFKPPFSSCPRNDTNYNFACSNGRCIASSLTCDGWNNCGDDSDELDDCGSGITIAGFAGIGVGSFIVLVIIVVFFVVWGRRRLQIDHYHH